MKLPKMSNLKPTYVMKRQLCKVIYQCIDRLDNLADTKALYAEVRRGFVYNLISKEDFHEMTRRLDAVVNELKEKENNYAG